MQNEANQAVIVGRIGRPHGVLGWNRIHSFTKPLENIIDYQPWAIQQRGSTSPISVLEVQKHGLYLIARLGLCTNRLQAQQLTGKTITINRNQLPPLGVGEYYWSDLVGLSVRDIHNRFSGTIDHLMETPVHDVIVVKGDKEYLIPYLTRDVVLSVDLAEKCVTVNWDPNF